MPPPWTKPLEIDRLAGAGAEVEFVIPLAELSGLRSLPGQITGEARGRVHFVREQGVAVAQLLLGGTATLECQRCLKPLQLPLDSRTRVALVASEAEVDRVPHELEPVLAAGGRISLGELITEELLLMLPIVPLHAGSAACPSTPGTQEPGSQTHKPLADLAELLKR
jgi:uncharacterized protein